MIEKVIGIEWRIRKKKRLGMGKTLENSGYREGNKNWVKSKEEKGVGTEKNKSRIRWWKVIETEWRVRERKE